jgi:NAD(P)-dependent dehydrogenase (short-subunit alcohol dehydrogenase family)
VRLPRDLWHEQTPPADGDELGLLRYRSNLLGADAVASCAVDISSRDSIRCMFQDTVRRFGGLDIIVNTVAVFPSPDSAGRITDAQWHSTLTLNVTANYLLADEAAAVLDVQQTPASILRQRGHPWAMGI